MRKAARIVLTLLLAPPLIAAVIGWFVAPAFLHPQRCALTADLVQQAHASFATVGSKPEDFDVRAPGWHFPPRLESVRPAPEWRLDLAITA